MWSKSSQIARSEPKINCLHRNLISGENMYSDFDTSEEFHDYLNPFEFDLINTIFCMTDTYAIVQI